MPMKKERYPSNWKQITADIRARASDCCETCGVRNGAYIYRHADNKAVFIYYDPDTDTFTNPHDGSEISQEYVPEKFVISFLAVKVVLTIHHIGITREDGTPGDPHDKADCRPENLTALCQRCHLIADGNIHVANAKLTRSVKRQTAKHAAGQLGLFADIDDDENTDHAEVFTIDESGNKYCLICGDLMDNHSGDCRKASPV